MANYDRESEDFSASRIVTIQKTDTIDNYTVYDVKVCLGHTEWTVKHRYNEFYELHEKLVAEYKIDKNLLPPKRYLNKSESFIKKRQKQLESYLQTVLRNFVNVPSCLATFLVFDLYEIHGITQEMALQLFQKGDQLLEADETFYTTPIQLYSVCTRLKLAQPTCESGDKTKDIGHILDFITLCKHLRIDGSSEKLGTSNIVSNQLAFHLQSFRSLEKLQVVTCNPSRISGIENVKKSLKKLQVHNSLKALKDLLLLDMGFGQWLVNSEESVLVPAWHNVHTAVFSRNDITYIDESVKLLPRVKYLDLSHNKLHEIQELQHLPHLIHVDLSYNNIRQLNALHTKFGNIKSLNITGNYVQSLQGFSKLYSLETLEAKSNEISEITEVACLGSLPCLEKLYLNSNPVTSVVDYRTKVLELFKDRAKEVLLDGKRPTQKEVDTVAVLVAIQKSKQTQQNTHIKTTARQTSIAESNDGAIASHSTPTNISTDSASEVTEDLSFPTTNPSTPNQTSANYAQSQNALLSPTSSSDSSSESTSTPNSTSAAPNTSSYDDLYRNQVENMREQGGSGWLNLLNQMDQSPEEKVVKPKEHAHSYRYHYEEKHIRKQGKTRKTKSSTTESDSSSTDESSIEEQDNSNFSAMATTYQMYTEVNFMLPESMPSRNDSTFLTHLQVMTPDTHALGRRSGVGGIDIHHREERPVHLMWAPTIQYSAPYKEFPACIYITTENIHIFEVKALTSQFEIPEMSHVYCIPLMNVQQIALGYQNLYIRIEEAFVGPNGTFTFLTCNSGKTDLFLDSLKLAYRRAVPDFDQYEDPHVVVNTSAESNLKQVLAKVEQVKEDKVELMMYMIINMCSRGTGKKFYTCHTLVITSRYLFVLREDYIFWPQPTFSIGPSTRPEFEVVAAFPIHSRISQFQMYDSDTGSPLQNQSLASTFSATNTSAMLTPNFIGYGVKLIFDLGGASGTTKELDIRMSTPNVRNKFLEALTSARGKLTDKSPQKVRFRLKDNDASNESTSSSSGKGTRSKRIMKGKHTKDNSSLSSKGKGLTLHNKEIPGIAGLKIDEGRSQLQKLQPSDNVKLERISDKDTDDNLVSVSSDCDLSQPSNQGSLTDLPLSRDSPTGESANTVESVEETYLAQMVSDTYTVEDQQVHLKIKTTPPNDLPLGYPSMELLSYLTECNEDLRVLRPMSEALQNLASMTGEEVLNFFHSKLAQIGRDDEELRHILWTEVVPYVNAKQSIVTCIMLSTRALYFVSDDIPKQSNYLKQSFRKHVRYRSDTTQIMKLQKSVASDSSLHHMSGIVHKSGNNSGRKTVKAYCILPLKELKVVNIGLFDHSFRLSGDCPEKMYYCVTRDNAITETFARCLMSVLTLVQPSPSPQTPDLSVSGSEQDFYKMFRDRNYCSSLSESLEYVHPSKVRFIYPNDDVVADLTYVIRENMKGKKPKAIETNILSYMLCYKERPNNLDSSDNSMPQSFIDINNCEPRTIVLTEQHLTLAVEDYVSYPLPDFAKQPPMHKQHVILEVRTLEHLKRLFMQDSSSHDLSLVFADESEEVCVNAALEYYTPSSGLVAKEGMLVPEVTWTVLIQDVNDKQRFIKLVSRQWEEIHNGDVLPVQIQT